jgi:hypothetical protein
LWHQLKEAEVKGDILAKIGETQKKFSKLFFNSYEEKFTFNLTVKFGVRESMFVWLNLIGFQLN